MDAHFQSQVEAVEDLIKNEVNVKELEYLTDTEGVLTKRIKPNFKKLGKCRKRLAFVTLKGNSRTQSLNLHLVYGEESNVYVLSAVGSK